MATIESDMYPGVELDEEECVYCGEPSTQVDRYNIPWCEGCDHRRRLFHWGIRHDWPVIPCTPYGIGDGHYCWIIGVLLGIDEQVWMGLAYTELLDEQNGAA